MAKDLKVVLDGQGQVVEEHGHPEARAALAAALREALPRLRLWVDRLAGGVNAADVWVRIESGALIISARRLRTQRRVQVADFGDPEARKAGLMALDAVERCLRELEARQAARRRERLGRKALEAVGGNLDALEPAACAACEERPIEWAVAIDGQVVGLCRECRAAAYLLRD